MNNTKPTFSAPSPSWTEASLRSFDLLSLWACNRSHATEGVSASVLERRNTRNARRAGSEAIHGECITLAGA